MPSAHKNKVVYNGTTLIDLTADTVTPSSLMQGYTAHDASGAAIVGTSTAGTMVIRDTQDSHGGTVREITAGSVVTGTKAITSNGTYDVAAYADASVNVPSPEPELQSKTATPTESQQTVTPDSGYDGLSSVTVGAISSTYVGSGIVRRDSDDLTDATGVITVPAGYYAEDAAHGIASASMSYSDHTVGSNGVVTMSLRATTPGYADGLYSGSFTLPTQAAATITPSTSAQTAVAAGKYTTGAVTVAAMPTGTAGTPTATKGTVSNHSVSVTPSVTNTTGYITGGTKTGTAVNVAASELVSGTLSITSSGTKDVTNYASASVAAGGATASATKGSVSNHSISVTPSVTRTAGYISAGTANGTAVTVTASELVSGTYTVDSSGTKDVTNYASATVASGSATASATKGSVSNHSVSVTPSVTRTAGYITAGTANGTAVTVSASELVSGTLSVTENDTYDVTNYANVEVDVSNSTAYTATITRVGTGTNPRVQLNGTGTTYSANGATFTFLDGDYLYFYIGNSDYNRYVYVNGVLVSSDSTYYTWYPPCYDIGIEFEGDDNKRIVRITTPTTSVQGTFTVENNPGGVQIVTLPYNGSGYPIMYSIYPVGGFYGNTALYNLIQRYATIQLSGVKTDITTTPTYQEQGATVNENGAHVLIEYKNSTTNALVVGYTGDTGQRFTGNNNAYATSSGQVTFKNSTTMNVFIASTSYGFPVGIEYAYVILYSE